MTRRTTAVIGVVVAVVALTLAGDVAAVCVPTIPASRASAPLPPAATYAWAQPGTATVAAPRAQPPARVSTAIVLPPPPTTAYAWKQPTLAFGRA